MQKTPMTVTGAEQLQKELIRLKSEERPKIVKAIAEARAHGDLKENAEYHAAKELQGLTEARIRDLEHKLSNAQIIDITRIPTTGKVVFGATVTLIDQENPENEIIYKIVGDEEANIKNNTISIYSPMARALIGKQVDDVVDMKAINGKTFDIIAVDYV